MSDDPVREEFWNRKTALARLQTGHGAARSNNLTNNRHFLAWSQNAMYVYSDQSDIGLRHILVVDSLIIVALLKE